MKNQVSLALAAGCAAISLTTCAAPAKAVALLPEPEPFRSVVIGQKGGISTEYEAAFGLLKWPVQNFFYARGEMADDAFFDALKSASLVMMCPTTPDSLSARADELKAWLEAGGILIAGGFTEASFDGWLRAIGPEYASPEIWGNLGWSTPKQRELDPPDPLRVFPRRLVDTDQGHHWTNFQPLPGGSVWRVVSKRIASHREANNRPNIIRAPVGKGWIVLSNIRIPAPEWVENARAMSELGRLGLAPVSGDGFAIRQGAGTLKVVVKGDAEATKGLQLALEIRPRDGADEDQNGKPDKPQAFRAAGAADNAGNVAFALDYDNVARGDCRVLVRIGKGDDWATVLDETRHFPRLVEIDPPNYRGMVSAARRKADVALPFAFTPLKEKVENAKLEAKVVTGDGKTVVWTKTFRGDALKEKTLSLGLKQETPAGTYRLQTRLMRPGKTKPLFTNEVAFAIRATKPYQTFVDQDGVLLRGGEPWFPLGIYHASPADAARWTKMGFNAQQFWSWDEARLDEIHDTYGISVIYECIHNKSDGVVERNQKKYATNPAIAMWYLWDEPTINEVFQVKRMNERLHGDLERPTFIVCEQDTVAAIKLQASYGDVVAVDSYPISVKDGEVRGNVMDVPNRLTRMLRVLEGRRPLIAVLQAFGTEPPEHLRCMAYLALSRDVKGIYWYCWSQMGGGKVGIGINTNPDLQTALGKIVEEMKALSPALLAGGTSFEVEGTAVLGRYFGNKKTGRYLLLVNGSSDAAEVKVELPKLAKRKVGKAVVGDAPVSVKSGVVTASLPGLAAVVVEMK